MNHGLKFFLTNVSVTAMPRPLRYVPYHFPLFDLHKWLSWSGLHVNPFPSLKRAILTFCFKCADHRPVVIGQYDSSFNEEESLLESRILTPSLPLGGVCCDLSGQPHPDRHEESNTALLKVASHCHQWDIFCAYSSEFWPSEASSSL